MTKKVEPPDKVMLMPCPTEIVGFVVLKVTDWPAEPEEEVTVTLTAPQLLDWSQTVIVALPAATADIVSKPLDKLAETAPELEFPDRLYVPLPPDTVIS